MTTVGIAVTLLGFLVWVFVVLRAVKTKQELVVLALVLVVLGLITTQVLSIVGVEAPGAWSFLMVGVLLLTFWPKSSA